MKIIRTCEKCNRRMYHAVQMIRPAPTCICAGCGHTFVTRLKRDEKTTYELNPETEKRNVR